MQILQDGQHATVIVGGFFQAERARHATDAVDRAKRKEEEDHSDHQAQQGVDDKNHKIRWTEDPSAVAELSASISASLAELFQ